MSYSERLSLTSNVDLIHRNATQLILKRPKHQTEVDISTVLFQHPHPNVIQILDSPNASSIKMKYYSKGDLFDWMDAQSNIPLPISTVRRFFKSIVTGVAHCHGCGIIHRDLSLENVLLDKNLNCVISDFDLSCFKGEICTGIVGKLFYVPPEAYTTDLYDGFSADIWSLGIMLFILLTGMPPFELANRTDVRYQYHLKHGLLDGLLKPWKINLPHSALDLLQQLLDSNPNKRIRVSDILKHPFLNKI